MSDRWKPNLTVAAFIEHEGRLLWVRERTPQGLKWNNPAGHVESWETPEQAVCREVLEETGRVFTPQAVLGLYWGEPTDTGRAPPDDVQRYLRIAYIGTVGERLPGRELDAPIVETAWMDPAAFLAREAEHRSVLVRRGLEDFLAGRRFPLDLLRT